MEQIHVNLGPRSYTIAVVDGEPSVFPPVSSAFVVTDANAQVHASRVHEQLKASGVRTALTVLPPGENTKRLEMASRLYDELAGFNADRKTTVIAVGGGVVGDLAGFAAATYNRGLPLFMIPTTLLSMVDSSVGGKVGINHPRGKNLIGAFHQPTGVWIDIRLLATLPDREYLSGLAEVVKYGVIMNAPFFEWLEANADAIRRRDPPAVHHLVARSCRFKADVVENDEREETGMRMILNYGHTFGHAFEAIGGYGAWLHGEAIAAGMICASRLAEKRGMIAADLIARQIALLEKFALPVKPMPSWPARDLVDAMIRDKKTQAGKLRFILPTRLGEVIAVDGVPEAEVLDVLATAAA
jgi:3-dehydroquinate synthase